MSKSDKHKNSGADSSAPQEVPAEQVELTTDEFVEALQAEVQEWKEHSLRAQAEFENARKRLEERHAQAVALASEKIVKNIIPVLDDLDYALMQEGQDEAQLEGLRAIRTKLLGGLEREGVVVIDPAGAEFDPNEAQAVQMVPSAEVTEGSVVNVLQKGYKLGGRVLRSAMVTVSSGQ